MSGQREVFVIEWMDSDGEGSSPAEDSMHLTYEEAIEYRDKFDCETHRAVTNPRRTTVSESTYLRLLESKQRRNT